MKKEKVNEKELKDVTGGKVQREPREIDVGNIIKTLENKEKEQEDCRH